MLPFLSTEIMYVCINQSTHWCVCVAPDILGKKLTGNEGLFVCSQYTLFQILDF
jgi:hypothetical protein